MSAPNRGRARRRRRRRRRARDQAAARANEALSHELLVGAPVDQGWHSPDPKNTIVGVQRDVRFDRYRDVPR